MKVQVPQIKIKWQACYLVTHRSKMYALIKFSYQNVSIEMIEVRCKELGYDAINVIGFINQLSTNYINQKYPFLKGPISTINNFEAIVVKSDDILPGHSTLRKRFCYCLVEVSPRTSH